MFSKNEKASVSQISLTGWSPIAEKPISFLFPKGDALYPSRYPCPAIPNDLPFSFNDNLQQIQLFVEQYKIGLGAGLDTTPFILQAHEFRRVEGGHAKSFRQRETGFFHAIAHGLEHGEGRARQSAIRQGKPVPFINMDVLTIVYFGYGVCYKKQAVLHDLFADTDGGKVDVNPITDNTALYIVVVINRPYHPWLPAL